MGTHQWGFDFIWFHIHLRVQWGTTFPLENKSFCSVWCIFMQQPQHCVARVQSAFCPSIIRRNHDRISIYGKFESSVTYCAEALHQLRGDWVTELDLSIQRGLSEVVDELNQALEVCGGAQQVALALLLDPAVLYFTITSIRKRTCLVLWKKHIARILNYIGLVSLHLNVMAKESGSPSLCRIRKAPSLGILIR